MVPVTILGELFFAALDVEGHTAAVTAVWGISSAVTALIVVGVRLRMRKLRKQHKAREGARTIGQLRARAYNTFPGAADEEWDRIITALEERDR